MERISTIQEWRQKQRALQGKTIGFVPTMGYLHEGHLSLIEKARAEADIVVLSIFVNPLQFGANEDFSTYPRDLERDAQIAKQGGVDYLFNPSVQEMYPEEIKTIVSVKGVTEIMCGSSRPGHFDGVATVVMKLFQIIQPNYAYFGLKDAQQIAVIQQMVSDLNLPIVLRPCPIVRESDGLALSSRNVYLSSEERQEATILYKTLQWAADCITQGERNPKELIQGMKTRLEAIPVATVDYIEIRSFPGLLEPEEIYGQVILALAVRIGRTRLIDNLILNVSKG